MKTSAAAILSLMAVLAFTVVLQASGGTTDLKAEMGEHDQVSYSGPSPAMKIALSARASACKGMLSSNGDSLLDRVQCALHKGAARLKAIAARKNWQERSHDVANSISEVTSSSDFETEVGSGGGDYVGTIALGTPAKQFSVIMDTGSDLVWIQCKPCTNCFQQPDPLFDPSFSYSYHPLTCSSSLCQALPSVTCSSTCDYSYSYGDGSGTQGTFATETITLAKTDNTHLAVRSFAFGCGHNNQGTFGDASGLVGLGRGPISFPSQLGSLFHYKFSYCLVTWTDAASVTSPMYFGDAAVPTDARTRFTRFLTNPNSNYNTFYYVQLDGISIAGKLLSIPSGTFDIKSDGSGGVIVDSGTTLTYLATKGYSKVLQAFKSQVSLPRVDPSTYGLDLCYDVSRASAGSFPSMTFHFHGADYELPVENYFIPVTTSGDVWCLAMGGSSDFSVFGNIQQQNFHILYDLANNQFGFVPSTCG